MTQSALRREILLGGGRHIWGGERQWHTKAAGGFEYVCRGVVIATAPTRPNGGSVIKNRKPDAAGAGTSSYPMSRGRHQSPATPVAAQASQRRPNPSSVRQPHAENTR